MAEAAAANTRSDPEDTKKAHKEKWKNFFSLSNPDLWIALGVVALVIILVSAHLLLEAMMAKAWCLCKLSVGAANVHMNMFMGSQFSVSVFDCCCSARA